MTPQYIFRSSTPSPPPQLSKFVFVASRVINKTFCWHHWWGHPSVGVFPPSCSLLSSVFVQTYLQQKKKIKMSTKHSSITLVFIHLLHIFSQLQCTHFSGSLSHFRKINWCFDYRFAGNFIKDVVAASNLTCDVVHRVQWSCVVQVHSKQHNNKDH